MREYHRSATVPYAPESMFALVADVDSYAEFVPGCTASSSMPAPPPHGGGNEVLATLAILLGNKTGRFTTRNRLQPPRQIQMSLVEGPFSTLEGEWRIEPLADGGSRLELDMRFEFSNRLKDMVLGPVFELTCGRLVHAFLTRAKKLYG